MVTISHYTYRVMWSEEDAEHVALCAEFPSLSFLAETPSAALQGLMEVVEEVVHDLHKQGEEIPDPITSKSYSGKFMIRLTPDQHKQLAILAAEQGVSLNRLVASRLL